MDHDGVVIPFGFCPPNRGMKNVSFGEGARVLNGEGILLFTT